MTLCFFGARTTTASAASTSKRRPRAEMAIAYSLSTASSTLHQTPGNSTKALDSDERSSKSALLLLQEDPYNRREREEGFISTEAMMVQAQDEGSSCAQWERVCFSIRSDAATQQEVVVAFVRFSTTPPDQERKKEAIRQDEPERERLFTPFTSSSCGDPTNNNKQEKPENTTTHTTGNKKADWADQRMFSIYYL